MNIVKNIIKNIVKNIVKNTVKDIVKESPGQNLIEYLVLVSIREIPARI